MTMLPRLSRPVRQNSEVVLVVEDDPPLCDVLVETLTQPGRAVVGANSAAQARDAVARHDPAVVVLDLVLPDLHGLDFLSELVSGDRRRATLVLTAHADEELVVEAMRRGATDYHLKPFSAADIQRAVAKALAKSTACVSPTDVVLSPGRGSRNGAIVGRCPQMIDVYKLIGLLTDSDVPVLIKGESGTGKELVARDLHRRGRHASGPFLALDCGSLPPSLLEAELFGYERGAFTGAVTAKSGLMELANNGTLFLDEIGNLPVELQSKLLRVLQEKMTQRLGSVTPVRMNARVVSATNVDVEELVRERKLRDDLYFRLSGAEIRLPALRERSEDIPLLIQHFVTMSDAQDKVLGFTGEAMAAMKQYRWPGNVRELEHEITRIAALVRGSVVDVDDLSVKIVGKSDIGPGRTDGNGSSAGYATLADAKTRYAWRVMDVCGGNKKEAARILAIDRKTLDSLLTDRK